MRSVKVQVKLPTDTIKAITVKDITDFSVSNGALEVFGDRKDAKEYSKRVMVAGFAKDVWLYFEEA